MLVGVSPPALFRLIGHLFHAQADFQIIAGQRGLRGLERQAERLLPELIVLNIKPVSRNACRMVASLKRSSPGSKLILICPAEEYSLDARHCGVAACLEAEELIRRLVPTVRKLSAAGQPRFH